MQTPEDDNLRSSIFNVVSSGAENALKVETDLLRANPRVPWSVIQTCNQKKKDESVADFRAHLEALLLQVSGFHSRDEVTQPALATLFVNSLCPEVSGLIKRPKQTNKKMGWEATCLTTVAEHFKRTLEQDCKQKSTKLLVLKS